MQISLSFYLLQVNLKHKSHELELKHIIQNNNKKWKVFCSIFARIQRSVEV